MSQHASNNYILRRRLRSLLSPATALTLCAPGIALAGPIGEDVIRGHADVTRPDANNTIIKQYTDRAVINWQSFNVDADEYVIFNQLDASSIVLNRVLGGDTSYILGHIQANGQVFLLNPNGVFFTHGASLDVQGFLASTLDMNPDSFMNGDFTLTRDASAPATASVINDGNITAGPGGYVVLAGDYTENTGIITANAGTVALVSGNALTLDIQGDGLVSFTVDEATLSEAAGVRNAGSLIADGGRVIMTAKVASDLVATAVNNEGLVRAHSVEQRNGEIYLVGNGGDVVNSGTLDADGENANGGGIAIYSDRDVTLADGGVQTAAGDANHEGGVIRAIAEEHLDYRKDNLIRVTGGINGGFVEVSGHGSIALRGIPQIGAGGTYLIDPATLTIGATSGTSSVSITQVVTQLNNDTDVFLVASNSVIATSGTINASGTGDLTIGIGTISGACGGAGGALCIGSVIFNQNGVGTINLSSLDINIVGNLSIDAGYDGTVMTSDLVSTNGGITINGGPITTGSLNAAGDVVIQSEYLSGNGISVIGDIIANNVTINASPSSAASALVNINGQIDASGDVAITAVNATSAGGGSIDVTGGIIADGMVTLTASGFGGNVRIGQGGTIGISAGTGITITATGSDDSGGRIEIGAGSSSNFTAHDVSAMTGNIILTATGPLFGGQIRVGGISATTGSVNLTASGEASSAGQILVGDIVSFNVIGEDITAGGAITIDATGRFDTLVETGNLNGESVTVNAVGTNTPEDGSGEIIVGNVTTTLGDINLYAQGVSFGAADITAASLDAASNIIVDATGDSTVGATASVQLGDVRALGDADIYAGAATGDPITIDGNVNVDGNLWIWNRTNGNVAINGSVEGGAEVKIEAFGTASGQGRIDVTGPIDGADIIMLASNTGFSNGGVIVASDTITGTGTVTIDAIASGSGGIISAAGITGSAVTLRTQYNGSGGGTITVSGATVATAGDIEVVGIAPGNVQASFGDISAQGNVGFFTQGSVGNGNITLNGNVTATTGNITFTDQVDEVSFSGGVHTLHAGGDILLGSFSNMVRIEENGAAVNYDAGGDIHIEQLGDFVANDMSAGGLVNVIATGISNSIGDIHAGDIDLAFAPSDVGAPPVNVTLGNLTADGNINVNIDPAGTSGTDGHLVMGSAAAENGGVYVYVMSSAPAGSGTITINGAVSAHDAIELHTRNDVTTKNLTVNNTTGYGRVEIFAGSGGSGDVTIDGDISASGRASSFPHAAQVHISNEAVTGNITVTGTTTINATAGNYSGYTDTINDNDTGTFTSDGNQGIGSVHAFAQDGDVSLGDVSVNAVGTGFVGISGRNVEAGDIAMNVADGSFTRVSDLSMCDGITCNIDRTETMHDGGRAEVHLESADGMGSSAAFGNIDITAGNARVDVRGFVDVTGGGIAINATGNNFEITSTGTFDGATVNYTQSNLGGGANVNIESAASGGAVILNGVVDIAARGNAGLRVLADTIKLRGVDVTASAGTFTRSGTPAGDEHDGPFSGNGGGGPDITEGTITGGGAQVQLAGYNPDPNFEPPNADSLVIDGAVNIAAPGRAKLAIQADAVTVTGDIALTATHVQKDGTADETFIDEVGDTIHYLSTVMTSFGEAGFDITGNEIDLAGVSAKGPSAHGRIEGVNITVGAVNLEASGGSVVVEETETVNGGTPVPFEFDGPSLLAGLVLYADNTLELTGDLTLDAVGAGGVILRGTSISTQDITLNVTDGNYSVLSPELSGTTTKNFTLGNAILGIVGATADVNGSVTMNASQAAHFGGAVDASGNFTITAGTDINNTVPDTVQFLNRLENDDDDSTIVLPPAFDVQAVNIRLAAGGDAVVAGDLTGDALAVTAGDRVDLSDTSITVGNGRFNDFGGDTAFLSLLALEGLAAPDGGPNLLVQGQDVSLGGIELAGDYLFIKADTVAFNGTVTSGNSGLLVQLAPFDAGTAMRLTQSGTPGYSNTGHLGFFDGTTFALGTTANTGDMIIAADGATIDIGASNLFVLTTGTVTGLDNVLSTGIVKDLRTLIEGEFEIPQTDEIDTSQNLVQSLRDDYELDDGEDDEGDEEGEDTDTDTGTDGDEDELISRDTVDEEMMCQ